MWDPYRELVERYPDMLPESVLIRSEIATNPMSDLGIPAGAAFGIRTRGLRITSTV